MMDFPDELNAVLRSGKPEALGMLYDHAGAALYRYALSILRSEAHAEEVVQVVFLKLARNFSGLSRAANARGYLYGMMRNAAFDFMRDTRRREVPLVGYEHVLVREEDGDRTAEEVVVLAALKELPSEQQEVVVLKIFEGMTFEEIGEVLEISENTAASRYRYGLAKLKRVAEGKSHE